VGEDVKENTFYVDFEKIRNHGGYVYWYDLFDLLKPNKNEDTSYKEYRQGDCKLYNEKKSHSQRTRHCKFISSSAQ
jgi:hypothetical protein